MTIDMKTWVSGKRWCYVAGTAYSLEERCLADTHYKSGVVLTFWGYAQTAQPRHRLGLLAFFA